MSKPRLPIVIWATDDESKSGTGHLFEVEGGVATSICGRRTCKKKSMQTNYIERCTLCERKLARVKHAKGA